MKVKLFKLEVQTRKDQELVDVTETVEQKVAESGVRDGLVNIMTMHTSSGIIVTEGLPCLEMDIIDNLDALAPESGNWHHNRYLDIDGRIAFNAPAHLKSILGNYCAYFPVEGGKMVKGSRQRIYFAEYDGPLLRSWTVQVIGE